MESGWNIVSGRLAVAAEDVLIKKYTENGQKEDPGTDGWMLQPIQKKNSTFVIAYAKEEWSVLAIAEMTFYEPIS